MEHVGENDEKTTEDANGEGRSVDGRYILARRLRGWRWWNRPGAGNEGPPGEWGPLRSTNRTDELRKRIDLPKNRGSD